MKSNKEIKKDLEENKDSEKKVEIDANKRLQIAKTHQILNVINDALIIKNLELRNLMFTRDHLNTELQKIIGVPSKVPDVVVEES